MVFGFSTFYQLLHDPQPLFDSRSHRFTFTAVKPTVELSFTRITSSHKLPSRLNLAPPVCLPFNHHQSIVCHTVTNRFQLFGLHLTTTSPFIPLSQIVLECSHFTSTPLYRSCYCHKSSLAPRTSRHHHHTVHLTVTDHWPIVIPHLITTLLFMLMLQMVSSSLPLTSQPPQRPSLCHILTYFCRHSPYHPYPSSRDSGITSYSTRVVTLTLYARHHFALDSSSLIASTAFPNIKETQGFFAGSLSILLRIFLPA